MITHALNLESCLRLKKAESWMKPMANSWEHLILFFVPLIGKKMCLRHKRAIWRCFMPHFLPLRSTNVIFLCFWECWVLLGPGTEGSYRGEEPLGQDKILYILGDSALLRDYKGFNWRMKESKVLSDISGLGIWQSAAWRAAKSPGQDRKC